MPLVKNVPLSRKSKAAFNDALFEQRLPTPTFMNLDQRSYSVGCGLWQGC